MNKEEIIERYGEEEYNRRLERKRAYQKHHREEEQSYREAHRAETEAYNRKYRETHPEEAKACHSKWKEEHPEEVQKAQHDFNRKDGKYYAKHLEYMQTGIPGERHRIRIKHGKQYKPYKDIIAPESQIHHEWVPNTSDYRGVALVEADQHMHGFVDVIEILDGKITLLTEVEVKKRQKKQNGQATY